MSVNDHQLNLDWNQVQLMLWFVLHLVLLNFELTKSTFEWEQFFFFLNQRHTPIPRRERLIIDGRLMIKSFSLFASSTILVRFIERQFSLFSSSSSWSWRRFYKRNIFFRTKFGKRFFYTLVLEFSSVVITVKTGIFLSLSDKQRGKGFSRRCRFRSEMIWSFSLLSSRGVTVERVLSNNLINWSEWES